MGDSQFCLQWNSHNVNICRGLGHFQQNEEFVDMTLAADGHRVKVHQMVLALASPYLKELIADANCPHPVIFLNKVSYKTMCSILEYVYLGESVVSVDDISDLLVAAKELRIKGLEDVKTTDTSQSTETDRNGQTMDASEIKIKMLHPLSTSQNTSITSLKRKLDSSARSSNVPLRKMAVLSNYNEIENGSASQNEDETDFYGDSFGDCNDDDDRMPAVNKPEANSQGPSLQYSISNQGILKLILNRYIFSRGYDYRDGRRRWRCNSRNKTVCKANVVTQGSVVVRRMNSHNHPFHDRGIMRLVMAGKIFGTLPDAQNLKDKQLGTGSGEPDSAGAERPCEPDNTGAERPCEPDNTGAESPCERDWGTGKEHAESAVPKGDCESSRVAKAVIKVTCGPSKADLLQDRIRDPMHREKSGMSSHKRRHRTQSPRGAGMDNRESGSRTDRGKSSGRRNMPFI